MSRRRSVITPTHLGQLLQVLASFGFTPQRVELSPEGGVTLHADVAASPQRDLLAEWEAERGSRAH